MNEYAGRPGLPGYVSIKEAAQMLGLSDKRVYEYVDEGRFPSMWAADVITIPREDVQKFKRKSSGRPRKNVPAWRISSGDNTQFTTFITILLYPGQQDELMQKLEEVRQAALHTFPGTITRLIAESQTVPGQIEISLVWQTRLFQHVIIDSDQLMRQGIDARGFGGEGRIEEVTIGEALAFHECAHDIRIGQEIGWEGFFLVGMCAMWCVGFMDCSVMGGGLRF